MGDPDLKVYFASRFRRRFELQEYAQQLSFLDISTTSRWLYEDIENDKQAAAAVNEIMPGKPFAKRDLEDIRNSHAVVCFSSSPRIAHTNRGGYHVEFGYALAQGLVPVIVGPRENIFHALDAVMAFDEWGDGVMAFLCGLKPEKEYENSYH